MAGSPPVPESNCIVEPADGFIVLGNHFALGTGEISINTQKWNFTAWRIEAGWGVVGGRRDLTKQRRAYLAAGWGWGRHSTPLKGR